MDHPALIGGWRFVVAPDKFKGSLSAPEAAAAIARGFCGVPGCVRDAVCVPMADGGEGTVDAFVQSGARREARTVSGPLGAPVSAAFAIAQERLAVIEMASASGLLLLRDDERDPLHASTFGTGELLRAALDLGVERIILGIGGSATNDGGAGMLAALGVRFLDAAGKVLPLGAASLLQLAAIDLSGLDPRIARTTIEVACDVDNPLTGTLGAAHVFGAQKGATAHQIAQLDAALAHFADVSAGVVRADYRATPGAGAAGGLGFGLLAFLGAVLSPGVDVIARACGLRDALREADICITGEGRIDLQTLRGKTVMGVVRLAREEHVPVIAFGGWVDAAAEAELLAGGLTAAVPITAGPMSLDAALSDAAQLLEAAAARVGRLLLLGHPGSLAVKHGRERRQ